MNRRTLCITVAMIVVAIVGQDAMAQKRSVADRRQHPGVGYWTQQSSSRRIGHALDYSRGLSDYAQRAKTAQPEFARSHVEEIGRNITVAQKELIVQRKEAEASGDKSTMADIDKITKDLKAATEAHANCKEHCEKGHIDTVQLSESAAKVTKALQAASNTQKEMIKRQQPDASEAADSNVEKDEK